MSCKIPKSITVEIIINLTAIPFCSIREISCWTEHFFNSSCILLWYLSCITILPAYNSGLKINLTGMGIVYTTNIKYQNIIDINPHVVIAIEFIDHGFFFGTVRRCYLSSFWLKEITIHFHTKLVIIRTLSLIKYFSLIRIAVIQFITIFII